ncbi:Hpt domain-containing protein [Lachnospiraceae bacterium 62-35]
MDVKEFYSKINVDGDVVLRRFMGKETMVIRFLKKFLDDGNFAGLDEALKNGDYEKVLVAAHSLKGVSGNLGLDCLYNESTEIVKAVREGRKEEVAPRFEKLKKDYQEIVQMIREFQ